MWLHKWKILLWELSTFRSLLWSWEFICSCQISLLHFLTSKSEQRCGFLYVFIFVLGFWQTLFAISARSLLTFPPISSSLSSSCIRPFRLKSESSSSDSLLVPKILLCYQLVHHDRRHEDWPCHHIYALIHHHLTLCAILSSRQP